MANTNSPFGFRLHGCLANHIPKTREYVIAAGDGTATFVGDLVKPAGSGDVVLHGCPTVVQGTAAAAALGVMVGMKPDPSALTRLYRPASTAVYVNVVDDPFALYEAQEDAVGGALAADDISLNVDVVVGSGSTVTGASGMQVDSSEKNTTATLPLKFLGFVDRVDNEMAVANAKVIVKINNHTYGSHTGTAGV